MQTKWTRSNDGILFGVCTGIAKRFEVDVMLVRLALVFAVLFFGFGIGAYICFAVGLPTEEKIHTALEPRFLGVCSRFAQRFDLDVGLTRVFFALSVFCSVGLVFLAYVGLYYTLPTQSELLSSSVQKVVK